MNAVASPYRACLYLQAQSIRNAVVRRIQRLRQPKYLFGALAGGAYLYFFLFRRITMRGGAHASAIPGWLHDPALASLLLSAGALVLAVVAFAAWLLPGERTALRFSEAEVAFLFPAPMTRPMLVRYKLLRSQATIFVSAFLVSLIVRRGSFLGGNPLLHAAGWWLLFSTLNLHFIGASFARDRLRGLRPALRLLAAGVATAVVVALAYAWHARIPSMPAPGIGGGMALAGWAGDALATPPLAWVLWPFKLVVAPLLALDAAMFWRALPACLLVLGLHFLWVVRSDRSFEDAAIERARRHALRKESNQAGKSPFARAPTKPRPAPFALAPQGFAPVALLWKNLIAMGPLARLRTWLVACAIAIAFAAWLGAAPERSALLKVVFGLALGAGGWLLFVGPMLVQRSLRRMLLYLDVLKASPLPGWQVVLGELLAPMALLSFLQWFLLVLAVACAAFGAQDIWSAPVVAAAAVGLALLVPALCGLMLCVPFTGLLLFPAWSASSGGRGGGIEVMGQRMIFFGGYAVVLLLALLPAALLGGAVFLLGSWLGNLPVALLLAAVIGCAVLLLELLGVVRWLGRRLERIDLSRDLPA
jgi:hypothetical protein